MNNLKKSNTKLNKTAKRIDDENYLKWKLWINEANFGVLKNGEANYFDLEISKTKTKFIKNSKVLEIGLGNGNFLEYAKQNNWDIFGIETNKSLVKIASQKGFNAIQAQDISLFKDNTFDLIVAFDVIEHIPQNLLCQFFLEINKKLKSGGFFIARFPNGDSPIGLKNQHGDISHLTVIGVGKIGYFANISNLKIISFGGAAEPIIGVNLLTAIHRIFALPIKKIINFIVNALFSPGSNLPFCSSNITVVFKALKSR